MENTPNKQSIRITDPFWKAKKELVRKEVIPYQWDILNDRVKEAEKSYCMHNFRAAARLNKRAAEEGSDYKAPVYTYRGFQALPEDPDAPDEDSFYGFVFQDSDLYKWIEAASYSLATHPDPELQNILDGAIDSICKAQQDDGYLDTYYILNGTDRCFTDLRDHHELYCLGHLIEAAVANFECTGEDKLLNAAIRFADLIGSKFGTEEGKIHGYPGHEIAEMALVRLFKVTNEKRFLDLARYFIDERGKTPNYFESEHPDMKGKPDFYHQAHTEVRNQSEAVGHAVRAVYLYSGMADVGRLTGDKSLTDACERLWDSITREKMYVTGGIGGTSIGEAFSFPFDLPGDLAYAETCASIGLVFFARRMLDIRLDRKFSDVMELALYNGILSGMSSDGKSFFYVNPLEVLPEACHKDERKSHVKPVRQKWFGCACCPPNIARLISSLEDYISSNTPRMTAIHLYVGSETECFGRRITVGSDLPYSGSIEISVHSEDPFDLALRIPSWCDDEYVSAGTEGLNTEFKDGYLILRDVSGDRDIKLDLKTEAKILISDNRVKENKRRAAVARGPLVYCAEECDNGKGIFDFRMDPKADIMTSREVISGNDVPVIDISGVKSVFDMSGKSFVSDLYREYRGASDKTCTLRLIPYFLWANRGESEMSVFLGI